MFRAIRWPDGIPMWSGVQIDPLHLMRRSAAVWVPDGGYRDVGCGDDYEDPSGAPGLKAYQGDSAGFAVVAQQMLRSP